MPTTSPRSAYKPASVRPMPEVAPIMMIFLFEEDIVSKPNDSNSDYRQKEDPDELISFEYRQLCAGPSAQRIAHRHGKRYGIDHFSFHCKQNNGTYIGGQVHKLGMRTGFQKIETKNADEAQDQKTAC